MEKDWNITEALLEQNHFIIANYKSNFFCINLIYLGTNGRKYMTLFLY